ncbi:hypothetical protein BBJ28_00016497 [Nothophytophthora sp. Chile5]|nr:hypothetical protein BBJ28_00016497 [Nothophytophthora sp. Chile5]
MRDSPPSGAEAVAAFTAALTAALAAGVVGMATAPQAVQESGSVRNTATPKVNEQQITAVRMAPTADFDSIKREAFRTAEKEGPQRLLQYLRSVSQGPNGRELLRRLASAHDDPRDPTLLMHAANPSVELYPRGRNTGPGGDGIQGLPKEVAHAHAEAACRFLLTEAGADVNARGGALDSALEVAVRFRCEPVARLLLQNGADSESKDSALFLAAFHDVRTRRQVSDPDMLKLLLEFGADAENLGAKDTTALTAAADGGDIRIVERLLAAGVNIFRKDATGRTAAEVARAAGFEDVAQQITTEVRWTGRRWTFPVLAQLLPLRVEMW